MYIIQYLCNWTASHRRLYLRRMNQEVVRANEPQAVLLCEPDGVPTTPLFEGRAVLRLALRDHERLCARSFLEEEEGYHADQLLGAAWFS